MVSQLLFGETFELLEEQHDFFHVRNDWDDYEGWINKNQVTILSGTEQQSLTATEKTFVHFPFKTIRDQDGLDFLIPAGSTFYLNNDKSFKIRDSNFTMEHLEGTGILADEPAILAAAKKFLYSPYLWGGKTLFGFDCSGFIQVVMKMAGIGIPRDASLQVHCGEAVSLLNEAKLGDLAFFDDEEGIITHVGILISPEQIIHASGFIRTDPVDHQGIFNESAGRYTHSLRTIRRIIGHVKPAQ